MKKLQTRLSRRRRTSVARAVGTLALPSALAPMFAQADPPTPPRAVRIAPDSGSTATAPLFATPRSLRSSGMMEKPGWSQLPLGFIENQGQVDPQVAFYARAGGQTLWMIRGGIVFDLMRARAPARLQGLWIAEDGSLLLPPLHTRVIA